MTSRKKRAAAERARAAAKDEALASARRAREDATWAATRAYMVAVAAARRAYDEALAAIDGGDALRTYREAHRLR